MKAQLRIRVDFEGGTILSPGKVRLFELVDETGSIAKAASGIHMSYRRARQVIEALEDLFGAPLVEKTAGRPKGSQLTGLGRKVVDRYRATERHSALAARRLVRELARLAPDKRRRGARPG